MAKKKAAKKMGRPPIPETIKSSDRFGFRATTAWKEWLARLAAHCRRGMADVIDDALVTHAKTHGFKDPPPKR